MRKIISMNRWQLAVCWLSAAFLIAVSAWIAYAYSVHHEEIREEEHAALLFASDLIALRDSRAENDGNAPVYLALLESRIPQLGGRQDTERLASALKTDLVNTLAAQMETAVRQGYFSASFLRQLLREYLPAEQTQTAEKTEELSAFRPFGERDAVTASRELLGLRFLRSALCGEGKAAFCRNAYAAFDERGNSLRAYSVFSSIGEPACDEGKCLASAVRFVREEQGMRIREITEAWTQDGIRYVLLDCGEETALTGVRRDSGGICFFLRSLKKAGNVLQ